MVSNINGKFQRLVNFINSFSNKNSCWGRGVYNRKWTIKLMPPFVHICSGLHFFCQYYHRVIFTYSNTQTAHFHASCECPGGTLYIMDGQWAHRLEEAIKLYLYYCCCNANKTLQIWAFWKYTYPEALQFFQAHQNSIYFSLKAKKKQEINNN